MASAGSPAPSTWRLQQTSRVSYLETVAVLGLLADHVQHGVHELGALRVVSLGPVVTGAALAEHEVVRTEQLAEPSGADGVHGARLQVEEDGTRHVLPAAPAATCC